MKIYNFEEFIVESLPRQHSVDQLERVRKLSKSTDIGDKTIEKGANLLSHSNPIDDGIESYEDYMKHDKDIEYNQIGFKDTSKKMVTNYPNPQPSKKHKDLMKK
jgi:hypothetical protein